MLTKILLFLNFLFGADLYTWEIWLRGFCIGFLIFGGIIILIVFITMGINLGHDLTHDIDHDADISVDKDITIDKDISIDKDLTIDKDISIDKDLPIDHIDLSSIDHDTGPFHIESGTAAPLMLMLATFSITFGGLGLLLFWQEPNMNPYVRLTIILLSPVVLSIIVDQIWRRVARSESYRLPTVRDFLGREAVVSIKVDKEGGVIRVEIPGQLEPLKVPAKSAIKNKIFVPDELVFIVAIEGNFYLVDDSVELLKSNTKFQEEATDE